MTRIRGLVDRERLARCLADLVARHDGLRTAFEVVDGVPRQAFVPPFAPSLTVRSVADAPAADRWDAALRVVETECADVPDLAAGPPWRATLIEIADDEHLLLVALEHLVADVQALMAIPRELAQLYAARSAGAGASVPPPVSQWSAFVGEHETWLASGEAKRMVAYRRSQFADARPIDFGGGKHNAGSSEREGYQRHLARSTLESLEAVAAAEAAPPVAIGLTAVATMIHRRYHTDDFVVMMVSSFRSPKRRTEGVVGNYTNQQPIRVAISPDTTFRTLFRQVRDKVLEALGHVDVPTQVVFDTPNPLDHPLAAVVVSWSNLAAFDLSELAAGDARFEPVMMGFGAPTTPYHGGNPHFATMLLRTLRTPDGARLFATTAVDVLGEGSAAAVTGELVEIIEQFAGDPDRRVGEV